MKFFLILFFLSSFFSIASTPEGKPLEECESFFSLTAASGLMGENQFEHFHGFFNAMLSVSESGEIIFATTSYLSMNSHKELSKVVSQIYGPIKKYLFLGEIHKSKEGIDRIINTSRFSTKVDPSMVDNKSENLVLALGRRTQLLAPIVEAQSFDQNVRGRRHLNPSFDRLGSGNIRHKFNNSLNILSLHFQTHTAGIMPITDEENFATVRRAAKRAARYMNLIQKGGIGQPHFLTRLKKFLLELQKKNEFSDDDLQQAEKDLRAVVEVLTRPPVLTMIIGRIRQSP